MHDVKAPGVQLERRRHRILQAAAICFGRHGIRGTTIKEICDEGDFSPGLVYHYFKSKQEIVAAVAERFSDRELASLAAATATIQANTAPEKVIATLVESMPAGDGALALSLIAEASRDEALRHKLLLHEQRVRELVREVIQLQLSARRLKERDEECLVETILLLREGLRTLSRLRRDTTAQRKALAFFLHVSARVSLPPTVH